MSASRDDFEARVRGEITAEEYVRRIDRRIATDSCYRVGYRIGDLLAKGVPMFAVRWYARRKGWLS